MTSSILVGCAFSAGPLLLAEEGAPHATIVLGAEASPPERHAATELQRAVRLISGAELPIEAAPANWGGARILIGTPSSQPAIAAAGLDIPDESDDALVVTRRGETLYLAGNTPRGALYATYAFLEDILGVRWFWPGPTGEFLPDEPTLRLDAVDLRQSPSLPYRSLGITAIRHGDDALTDEWMARNRLNVTSYSTGQLPPGLPERRERLGFIQRLAGHNIVLPREYLEEHRDHLAEYGGKRQHFPKRASQLCWSNPGLQQEVGRLVAGWWQDKPFLDVVSFYPADHGRFCECKTCQEMGDVSTRWQKFSAAIMAESPRPDAEKKYWTLAYMGYRSLPQGDVAAFDQIGYTLYNACYRHLLSGDDPVNIRARQQIGAWQEKGARMGIRGYEFIIFYEPMFVPLVSWEVDQMAWAAKEGLVGYLSEIPPYGFPADKPPQDQRWVVNRLNLYAAAKASWNAEITARQIVDDWTAKIYGPAARTMADYYWTMEAAWMQAPEHITYFLHPAVSVASNFITPDLLARASHLLAKARELGGTTRRVGEQIALETAMLENWRKLHSYQANNTGNMRAYAMRSSATPPRAEDWSRAASLPPFEDKAKKVVVDQTDVTALWDEQALRLRVVCHDSDMKRLLANYRQHDQDIFADDSIEIFLVPSDEIGGYRHLAVNSLGARYDALTPGGMDFDRSWNPEWSAEVTKKEKSWSADITLPFAAFGGAPKPATSWKFAIKRTRQGNKTHPHSGWPDASYHNPGAFGSLEFVENVPAATGSVLIYEAGKSSVGLATELLKNGWQVTRVTTDEQDFLRELQSKPTIVLIRYLPGPDFSLSASVLETELRRYVEDGGRVLFSAASGIPLHTWFDEPDAAVTWSGWRIDPNRVTTHSLAGNWSARPNDLSIILKKKTTPASGFIPSFDSWETLATLRLDDGSDGAYLLRRSAGKGTIILTSSNLGYAGGHEIFGSKNPKNAAMLVENLALE